MLKNDCFRLVVSANTTTVVASQDETRKAVNCLTIQANWPVFERSLMGADDDSGNWNYGGENGAGMVRLRMIIR